jgi:anti-sigma regulatory factor (Ser/Thr protein kinase)
MKLYHGLTKETHYDKEGLEKASFSEHELVTDTFRFQPNQVHKLRLELLPMLSNSYRLLGSPSQDRGANLYVSSGCSRCHGPLGEGTHWGRALRSQDARYTAKKLCATLNETASCLYAIAREALLNISKHARASRVVVELTTLDSSVSLSIADDGIGFPVEAASAGMGLGVVNMRERVRWLKGRFSLESQPGHGARITVQIPIAGEAYEALTSSAGR